VVAPQAAKRCSEALSAQPNIRGASSAGGEAVLRGAFSAGSPIFAVSNMLMPLFNFSHALYTKEHEKTLNNS
jgi:hypothetical protein